MRDRGVTFNLRAPLQLIIRRFEDRGKGIERGPMCRAARPEDRHRRSADGGGDVHQSRVIRHRGVGSGERDDRVAQISSGEIARRDPARRCDLRGEGCFIRSAQHPDRISVAGEYFCQRRVMFDRPRLAGADRARRQCNDAALVVRQSVRRPPCRDLARIDADSRQRPIRGWRRTARQRQGAHAVDHPRQRAFALPDVVEQRQPQFAKKSGAHRNAG
jgi:hypothetical protein